MTWKLTHGQSDGKWKMMSCASQAGIPLDHQVTKAHLIIAELRHIVNASRECAPVLLVLYVGRGPNGQCGVCPFCPVVHFFGLDLGWWGFHTYWEALLVPSTLQEFRVSTAVQWSVLVCF